MTKAVTLLLACASWLSPVARPALADTIADKLAATYAAVTDIGAAIAAKGVSTNGLVLADYADAIRRISGGDPVPPMPADWGYRLTVLDGGATYYADVYTNAAVEMAWTVPSGVTSVRYLVVGGGGGGGYGYNDRYLGGSGGGGAALAATVAVEPGSELAISVGAGGAGAGAGENRAGDTGGESSLGFGEGSAVTAPGGGGGGSVYSTTSHFAATSAGTGGGGAARNDLGQTAYAAGTGDPGGDGALAYKGGPGGGGGGAAGDAEGGAPGAGLVSDIIGSSAEYGRGGAGVIAAHGGTAGADGIGEGGMGGSTAAGTRGGSGVVILRYKAP